MASTGKQPIAIAIAVSAAALVLGSGAYLAIRGAHGAPLVVLLFGACALAAAVFLLARAAASLLMDPLVEEDKRVTGRRRKELLREKQALVKALKELEFDHEMRKISDADFREIAAGYRARAVRVMRLLDEGGSDYRKMIERDLAARGGAPGSIKEAPVKETPVKQSSVKEAAAPAIGRLPVEKIPAARPTCETCFTENDPDAAFCKRCGARLEKERAS